MHIALVITVAFAAVILSSNAYPLIVDHLSFYKAVEEWLRALDYSLELVEW